jgi:hypothetical protein
MSIKKSKKKQAMTYWDFLPGDIIYRLEVDEDVAFYIVIDKNITGEEHGMMSDQRMCKMTIMCMPRNTIDDNWEPINCELEDHAWIDFVIRDGKKIWPLAV